jgi:hypothetical protein
MEPDQTDERQWQNHYMRSEKSIERVDGDVLSAAQHL